jgi:hypothetical protein
VLTEAQRSFFQDLSIQLSPEFLYADGERSPMAAARLQKSLKRQWAALERIVGRPVTEDEAWTDS